MEVGTEAFIPNEGPKPSLPEVFSVSSVIENTPINFGVAKFGQEKPLPQDTEADGKPVLKKATIYMVGFPWQAKATTPHPFPAQIAEASGEPCYLIDAGDGREDPKSLAIKGKAVAQFLADKGIGEVVVVAHSAGGPRGAHTIRALQEMHPEIKVDAFVLADAMGLADRNPLALGKDFALDVPLGKKERQKGGVKAAQKGPTPDAVPEATVQEEFKQSLASMFAESKLGGLSLVTSQVGALTRKDPIYGELNKNGNEVPIWYLSGAKDRVSNPQTIFPEVEVRAKMAPAKEEDKLREDIGSKWDSYQEFKQPKNWDQLSPEMQDKLIQQHEALLQDLSKYPDKDHFIEDYLRKYRKQEDMFRMAKARAIVAGERHFGPDAPVRVTITDRHADHNGIPAARYEQTSNIISKIANFFRGTKKAS